MAPGPFARSHWRTKAVRLLVAIVVGILELHRDLLASTVVRPSESTMPRTRTSSSSAGRSARMITAPRFTTVAVGHHHELSADAQQRAESPTSPCPGTTCGPRLPAAWCRDPVSEARRGRRGRGRRLDRRRRAGRDGAVVVVVATDQEQARAECGCQPDTGELSIHEDPPSNRQSSPVDPAHATRGRKGCGASKGGDARSGRAFQAKLGLLRLEIKPVVNNTHIAIACVTARQLVRLTESEYASRRPS